MWLTFDNCGRPSRRNVTNTPSLRPANNPCSAPSCPPAPNPPPTRTTTPTSHPRYRTDTSHHHTTSHPEAAGPRAGSGQGTGEERA
ncbi:hypothetical protein SCA03_46000 [Streptomyces cacaoi]|uniref:Uncharacterized protein n=1 Tax=Streptomyces cacaoi TaxID=1898 RepID=A0A4Y3R3X9_STRCI|nr:hypothetical protein SCA03_46000 [Streptomyces cacaoi]